MKILGPHPLDSTWEEQNPSNYNTFVAISEPTKEALIKEALEKMKKLEKNLIEAEQIITEIKKILEQIKKIDEEK